MWSHTQDSVLNHWVPKMFLTPPWMVRIIPSFLQLTQCHATVSNDILTVVVDSKEVSGKAWLLRHLFSLEEEIAKRDRERDRSRCPAKVEANFVSPLSSPYLHISFRYGGMQMQDMPNHRYWEWDLSVGVLQEFKQMLSLSVPPHRSFAHSTDFIRFNERLREKAYFYVPPEKLESTTTSIRFLACRAPGTKICRA